MHANTCYHDAEPASACRSGKSDDEDPSHSGPYFQRHQGDWEHVDIFFDIDFRPLAVHASEHKCGSLRLWNRVESWTVPAFNATRTLSKVQRAGNHPIIFVARGSHANYFKPGSQSIHGACFGSPAPHSFDQAWSPRNTYARPPAWMVPDTGLPIGGTAPVGVANQVRISRTTDWVKFAGEWGQEQVAGLLGGAVSRTVPGGPGGLRPRPEFRNPLGPILDLIVTGSPA